MYQSDRVINLDENLDLLIHDIVERIGNMFYNGIQCNNKNQSINDLGKLSLKSNDPSLMEWTIRLTAQNEAGFKYFDNSPTDILVWKAKLWLAKNSKILIK